MVDVDMMSTLRENKEKGTCDIHNTFYGDIKFCDGFYSLAIRLWLSRFIY